MNEFLQTYAALGGFRIPDPQPWKTDTAVDWRDDIPFQRRLLIRAESWKPPVLPIGRKLKPGPVENRGVTHGAWGYHLIQAKKNDYFETAQNSQRGHAWFDGDAVIPALWKDKPKGVWMSITPSEIFTCRPGVRWASGKVVVGGLGLGWMLDKIAAKKTVTDIVVVENDRELLDWYGEDLVREIGRKHGRDIKVEHEDVFKFSEHTHLTTGAEWKWVLDVWQDYGDARWSHGLQEMRRWGLKVWAWGESAHKREYR